MNKTKIKCKTNDEGTRHKNVASATTADYARTGHALEAAALRAVAFSASLYIWLGLLPLLY